jgi:N6-L-threonylcarbamoyladenine synthase
MMETPLNVLILGIESSCDETAVALVEDGKYIRANQVASQIDLHRQWGGVVPELASRSHVEAITPLIEQALTEGHATWSDIDAIAVTHGPGLQGALLVGYTAARTLSWLLDRPLIGVNHLEGHVYANFLAFNEEIPLPLLVLLVSGGHTQLIEMRGHGDYHLVGQTRDDAIGEAFDKVARLLGLSYPGGPAIDALAKTGNPKAFAFPRSMLNEADFSFSGLKTAVLYTLRDLEAAGQPIPVADICASFQQAAVETVVKKALRYARTQGIQALSITGGVSANSALRQLLENAQTPELRIFMPPLALCTDNAAMIAACAWYRWTYHRESSAAGLEIRPRLPLNLAQTQNKA